MKISGLLYDELLIEHLGNLNSVDKELVSLLTAGVRANSQLHGVGFEKKDKEPDKDKYDKLDVIAKPGYVKSAQNHETAWSTGRPRETHKLHATLGRNSTLTSAELSIEEADSALKNDHTVAGLIYVDQGKQALIIVHDRFLAGKNKKAAYNDNNSYTWKLTSEFVRKLTNKPMPITTKPNSKSIWSELSGLLKPLPMQKTGKLGSEAKVSELFKLLAMKDWLEENPAGATAPRAATLPKLDLLLIKPDTTRAEIHAGRKLARKGYAPVPKTPVHVKMPGASYLTTTHNVYVQNLFNGLMHKLNDLKGSRAVKFNNAVEMLQFIVDKGYVEKITFLDAVYNLKDHRVNFSNLLKGSNTSNDESYVEYQLEQFNDEYNDKEFKDARAEIKQLSDELKAQAPTNYPKWLQEKIDASETPEAKAELIDDWKERWAFDAVRPKSSNIYMKHKCKPAKIKVILALDGGKIVPFRLDFTFSRYG